MKRLLLSLPILTVCLAQQLRADAVVVFNEIMYHPATNEPAMEWVELRNALAVDVDISDWSITGGINYTFASNTIVRGRGFLVVSVSPDAFTAATGVTNVLGPFTGRLGNNGDTLRLRNNSGRVMDEVSYGVEGDWPVAADGAGVSLAKRDPDSASAPAENWTASQEMGGTPGGQNFPNPNVSLPDTQLLNVTASWKYEASGADLGTVWRNPGYNDAAWGSRSNLATRTITNLYNTGVGDNRQSLAAGANDPHYILSAGAQGTVGAPALVILNHPAWLANDTVSSFIGVLNPGSSTILGGGYNFRTTFSLAGLIPGTARVNLSVAVDNTLSDVFINGSGSGLTTAGFAAFNPVLTLAGGFVSGNNTLEFRMVNEGDGPGGFRALVNGTGLGANTNAPLPGGRPTYYFRQSFTFNGDPALTRLRINPILADGGVLYLNGAEVFRQNMPGGTVSYSTAALSNVASPDYSGLVEIPATSLLAGANVFAVEIHQAAASTDEPILGLELISTPLPAPSPAITPLAFNEVSASTNTVFWLELFNYGTNPVPLAGFVIRRDGAVNGEYVFPSGPAIPAGGYLAVSNATLGFLPADGDRLFLLPPTRNTVIDSIVLTKGPRARSSPGTGPWLRPNASTPGSANTFALRNEIVINEIMYNHALLPPLTSNSPPRSSPEAWIELYNRSGSAVDLGGWELGGGISYLFTPGQSIPAGGYLVVADDVPYLRALHPGINIVGDFGGRLSGKSDHIVLKDPTGNPADEVRYFNGGHWPEYAAGGGSSLELRDPNSDNSKAEAWAASDETSKTSWQSYSYRMVANIPAGSGQPVQWQDFILGLQSIGECLIDDLSVVESPGATPSEIISNGNFENGLSGWRVLGTHNRSRVEPEPGNPGNNVLHLISTGYQEHMHNHIERTLNAGKTIVTGREYQISYRARWLAGNNLLNTRLYFNRSARTVALPMPALNGTPGAPNSRFEANVGPTFSSFGHQRVAPQPGEPVTVSVVAEDPQGVASVQVFWSVNSGAWQNAVMTSQGGGLYTGTIPGQSAATVVQFYVRAVDGLGAEATFPALGTNSGALYKVNDGQANLPLAHNVRIILNPSNIDLLHGTAQGVNQTNVMSNDLLPCTVVYDEQRAYYNCGVHLRGSQRGRYSDTRTGFHIVFQPDDLFRGVHPLMLIDRSGAGDATANRQEEIVLKHILNRAGGIPGTYGEICHLLSPRPAHVGAAQFFPRHEDNFIETAFENGGSGTMFEMELIYYPTSTNAFGYKNPQPDGVIGTDVTNLGDDQEIYRYNFMIKNHRDADDYRSFIELGKAWSLNGGPLDAATRELMDINEWMRAYALVSLCAVGDMYTFGNNHNFFMYVRPSDGKFLYFPWDMDFAFTQGASGALVGDQNLGKIVRLPGNLRCLYAHMLDIMDISFNPSYMAYWTDHYAKFAPGQNYSGAGNSLGILTARAPFVRNTINAATGTNFTVNGGTTITTDNNLVILTGTAPAQVKTIWINGVEYPVTWTSVSAWRIAVSVSDAASVLNLVGHDVHDRPLTNFTRAVTVNYTGLAPDPTGAIVINEIMFNPTVPNASFLELFNTSPTLSFDLSGWRINGLDYTFPKGSVITNRQYLVLADNISAYFAAYGTNATLPFDQFGGNLQADGETLTLIKPGTTNTPEVVIDKVRYEARLPWTTTPIGTSLQLVDNAQDNSRSSAWSAQPGGGPQPVPSPWLRVTKTGDLQLATNLFFWLTTAGSCYIDDISLTQTNPGSPNIVLNGDFENGTTAPWILGTSYTGSTVVNDVSHSGSRSLLVRGSAPGLPGTLSADIQQFISLNPNYVPNAIYTLTYWIAIATNPVAVSMRTLPGSQFQNTSNSTFIPVAPPVPVLASPGSNNLAVAANLPPYDAVWVNELQAENTTGLRDNAGERDPWIELYNGGTSTVDLSGYYLANNYDTNLTQWPFPGGTTIAPGKFKIIWADGQSNQTSGTNLHTSFRLNSSTGSVALVRFANGQPQITDYLTYGPLTTNQSYGDFPDGQPFNRQEFYRVTPGGTNDNVAPPIVVYINEWMAANTSFLLNTNNGNRFDDWFELYNPGATPANLEGYFLTDNLSNRFQFAIPAGYVIPPHGFLLVWADNRPNLNTNTDSALHVNFALSQNGEQLGLFASDGTPIDVVDFLAEPQFNNISQGRFPDGPTTNYFLATPTPLAPNSIWANRYPVLAPIPDASLVMGETLAFTASATDPDLPPQLFTYSLAAGAPTNATINATSGAFSWTPSPSQTPSTNQITVRVTDNGIPALSAARTFKAVVVAGFRISSIVQQPNGNVVLSIGATVGKTYRVEYKDDLNAADWTQLGTDQVAASTPLVIIDNLGGSLQRFYHVIQLN